MMRFIHAADIHLGVGFRSRPEIGEQLQARHREAWKQLVEHALAREVDALLLAGDVLDTSDPGALSWSAESALLRGLRRLAQGGVRVFIAPGNHDPITARSVYQRIDWPENVTVFDSPAPSSVELGGTAPPTVVYGAGFDRADVRENLAVRFAAPTDDRFHVAVLHCQVMGTAGAERHGEYAACGSDDLRNRGIHYWALGHVHQRVTVIDEPAEPILARYAGSVFPVDGTELGPKGCWLVEVDGDRRMSSEFLPLAAVRWEQAVVEVGPDDDIAAVEARIDKRVGELQVAGAELCLRLVLTGRTALRVDDPGWQEVFRAVGAEHHLLHLDVRNELRPAVDLERYADEPHVLGQLIARYRKMAQAPGGGLAEILGGSDELLRPRCEERVLDGSERAAYERRVLEQAMDSLADRLVRERAAGD